MIARATLKKSDLERLKKGESVFIQNLRPGTTGIQLVVEEDTNDAFARVFLDEVDGLFDRIFGKKKLHPATAFSGQR